MKKIISAALLAVCLLLGAILTAYAEGPAATLTASAQEVKAGETVTFTVSLSGAEGVSSGSVALTYDESKFEYVSSEWARGGDATLTNYDEAKKLGAIAFQSAQADLNGTFFTFTLRARTGAAAQTVSAAVQLRDGGTLLGAPSASATVSILCLSHSWGEWAAVGQTDCTEGGKESRTCSVCGEAEEREAAAPGHSWGEWAESKPATCTEKGVESRTCSRCQAKETQPTDALGHDFESPETVRQATLAQTGLLQGKCRRCGETTEQEIPCQATDSATGITLEATEGAFIEGSAFKVRVMEAGSTAVQVADRALEEVSSRRTVYELTVEEEDGRLVQPNGKVRVILPVPEGYGANVALYYIGESGALTEVPLRAREDGALLTPQINKVGYFALVDLDAAGEKPPEDEPYEEPEITAPRADGTGGDDTVRTIVILAAALVLAAGLCVAEVIRRRRSEK
ncbi:MAG: hypothetical protein IJU18_03490 [Oscillospiraceae bacterium]|nr:hypothetical protein [Oscillospiraceae bacterium]